MTVMLLWQKLESGAKKHLKEYFHDPVLVKITYLDD